MTSDKSAATSITKKEIRKTVNLPKTSFPMRANLAQNEALTRQRWQKNNLYDTLIERTRHKDVFVFHDGPPYANGNIHLGHLLNKVLKDMVVRSQFLLGKTCPFTPGWDCHGLPIEHKVMQEMTQSGDLDRLRSLPSDEQKMAIRAVCCTYAKTYIKRQSAQLQALLTLADYKQPYLTMTKAYEADTLAVFASLVVQKLVTRKLKPVHWSISNQTALAEAELEYIDKDDEAIYAFFPLATTDASRLFPAHTATISLLVWTTTPWTLPANVAIAVEENTSYALVQSPKGLLILAHDLIEPLAVKTGHPLTLLATLSGQALLGAHYSHPFLNQTSPIIHGDFVTTEDGSGLVHIAPGHGNDDYLVGLSHQLPIYCPVQADGTYDATVPDWLTGMDIWQANPRIIAHLKDSQHLFYQHTYTHAYPHDWRSKTPVIFRATDQWFITVDTPLATHPQSLRELALKHIDTHIKFHPSWGKSRLKGMLESRPDWCISRQRSWGLPIPAFKSGDAILLTPQSIDAIAELFRKEGSDAWFTRTAQELLAAYDPHNDPLFPANFKLDKAEKMYDIFDVWFESGSSWRAVLEKKHQTFPADLYLEGSDQHRGWFHLSLLPSLGVYQQAPYKQLLTHGFIVDKQGKKMSKSTGNTLDVEDILKTYGAEVTRWWVSSLSYETDIKVDLSYFDTASETYRKIRNTLRFLLSNLHGYTLPCRSTYQHCLDALPQTSIHSYVMRQFFSYESQILAAYTAFQFKQANHLLYECCSDLLSSFYCSIAKDTLYCDAPNSPKRQYFQQCFHLILEKLLRLLAPILPHTAEECYQHLYQDKTLLLSLAPEISLTYATDTSYWTPLLDHRVDVLKALETIKKDGLENSLDVGLRIHHSFQSFDTAACSLADIFGVSRVLFGPSTHIETIDLRNEPRCERSWKRDASVTMRSSGLYLSDRDAAAIGIT